MYNAEKHVTKAIESLINQTVDFKRTTKIILVDDGSTDQTYKVCKEFTDQYPDNIVYIYTENSGPGSARNKGLDALPPSTEYVGFLDADDYLSPDTIEKVDEFFNNNCNVQLAVIPIYHFGRIDTPQRLNYRFEKGSRIINILDEYTGIHFHIGGCFFKATHFINNTKWRFPNLRAWEDALLINSFLLEYQRYGVISEAKYYYRKHWEDHSLVNSNWYRKFRYTEMIRNCYLVLVNKSCTLYGEAIPYIQFLIIYHIRLYLFPKNNQIIFKVLNEQEQKEFFNEFVQLLQRFDDVYIKKQDMPFYYKKYLLNLKKHGWPYKNSHKKLSQQNVTITDLKIKGLKWHLEGNFMNTLYFMNPDDRLFIKWKNKVIYLPKVLLPSKRREIWGTVVRDYEHAGFKVTIPLYYLKFQFGIKIGTKKFILNKVDLLKERKQRKTIDQNEK